MTEPRRFRFKTPGPSIGDILEMRTPYPNVNDRWIVVDIEHDHNAQWDLVNSYDEPDDDRVIRPDTVVAVLRIVK